MNADYYFIQESHNVLFAHLINPRLAAVRFNGTGSIALSSTGDLQDLAARKRKLLYLTGLSLSRPLTYEAEPVPA